MFKNYTPFKNFFTKNNPQDLRLGDFAKSLTEVTDIKDGVVLLGYPDDEGIKNNSGRVGSKEAPAAIRDAFYRMTPHLLKSEDPKIYDLGDLKIEGTLEDRHVIAQKNLMELLPKSKVIVIGGGHDYGYPDGAAFLETFHAKSDKDLKPLIINFDAHLDVRPPKKDNNQEVISSGTPFYRLLKNYTEFDFLEIGIQSQCNSKYHLEWAQSKDAYILTYDEILYSGIPMHTKILEFLEPFLLKKRACYLSIDIDGFSSAFAPGCSQSFATGFNPESFLTVLKVLNERLDIRLLGIYEVSPPLDQDNKTSKLAAQLIFESL
jgi:formiminoglutamase